MLKVINFLIVLLGGIIVSYFNIPNDNSFYIGLLVGGILMAVEFVMKEDY